MSEGAPVLRAGSDVLVELAQSRATSHVLPKRTAAMIEEGPTMRAGGTSPGRPSKRFRPAEPLDAGRAGFYNMPLSSPELVQTARLPMIDSGPRSPVPAYEQDEESEEL